MDNIAFEMADKSPKESSQRAQSCQQNDVHQNVYPPESPPIDEINGKSQEKIPSIIEEEGEKEEDQSSNNYALNTAMEYAGQPNIFGRIVVGIRAALYRLITQNKRTFNRLLTILAVIIFHVYFVYTIYLAWSAHPKSKIDYCNGVGMLIIITGITYWSLFYYFVLKRLLGRQIQYRIARPVRRVFEPITSQWYFSYALKSLCIAGAIAFIVTDARNEPRRLISAAGVLVILTVCLLVSKHPGRVNWNHIFWGVGFQFCFGLMILRWEGGREAFDCISIKIKAILDFSIVGSGFIYGHLTTGVNMNLTSGDNLILPPIFAFRPLSVIFFFSFFINILYYYGIMMWVVSKLGWILQVTVGTTAAESMSAAANIFVGQTEAPILVKPFLPVMTKSELHAVMTGGFATIAGSAMGAYISFGINPSYLLSSTIMAAPAALALSKLVYPETEKSRTTAAQLKNISLKQEGNALDAAAAGAGQAVMLIGNIIANIIAFMSFVAFLNSIIAWFGRLAGISLSFEGILSNLFIPAAYIIGIEDKDVGDVALLLGLKTIVNEFVAYQKMNTMKNLSERSRAIATYALCSFANVGSIGVQLGGIGFMAPERRTDLSQVIWYAFFAGSVCGILNACIAGTLISDASINHGAISANSSSF